MNEIAEFRRFSRFYTGVVGALDTGHLDTPFSLSEARIIYEVATCGCTSAAEIARAMGIDPAHLSRLVGRLREQGVLKVEPSPRDKRQGDITLTEAGTAAFATLDAATVARIESLLTPLEPQRRAALVAAMASIRSVLGDAMPAAPLLLRPHRIGELGWLVHRQGLLYHQQFGWNIEFEALIAGLYRDFELAPPDPPKALWVAERNGAVVGSVYVVPSDGRPETAQLRMLYVEPEARGLGIGRLLVAQCLSFGREHGYERMRLWTQSILIPARKIYAAAGFKLVDSEAHHSFGADLVGETWEMKLGRGSE